MAKRKAVNVRSLIIDMEGVALLFWEMKLVDLSRI